MYTEASSLLDMGLPNLEWIISSTSYPIDNIQEDFARDILDQVENGDGRARPTSATDLSNLIVEYFISTYERKRKRPDSAVPNLNQNVQQNSSSVREEENARFELSIRQIFSHHINEIVRLFIQRAQTIFLILFF